MNAEKYTQKTLDAVKTAQSMAQENGNQYLTPEHLLYALVDQDGGLIASLFGKMGVDCDGLLSELDTLIRRLPKVSGGSGEVYASPETGKILNLAEKTAEKLHDDYISVEHLMLAIFSEGTSDVKQLLQSHGANAGGLILALSGAACDLAVGQGQGNGNIAAHALGSAGEITGHAACGGSGLAAAAVAQQTDTHNNRHGQRSHALADLILFHCFFLLIFGLLVFGHLSAKKGELLIRKAASPR